MTNYSEIEIETAKNLLKRGFKWITRSIYGAIIAYIIKPDLEKYISGNVICSDLVPIFESIRCDDEPVSLESIVHQQILDDAEREYLSAVIKPFRDRVKHICKVNFLGVSSSEYQYIFITLSDGSYDIDLPIFKGDTMYKGMKPAKDYTIEELGL